MTDNWLSLSQVAEYLGVHPSTVRSWADQGRLPVHRTRGGHRRFLQSEVELCIGAQSADEPVDVNEVVQMALKNTRVQVIEGHLEREEWYRKLDNETREQYRRGGRSLLQGLAAYLVSDQKSGQAEAQAIGYEYASIGRRCGLNSVEAAHAFLFFRSALMEAMLSAYESASVRSLHAWGDMLRKMNGFTDQILITLLDTYEAYQRNSR